jgi:dolichol-phosphate mannosyltransferase
MSVAEEVAVATEDRLAVIVPLYNEERTVVELLTRLIAQDVVAQVVIVDDGSTDASVPLVKEWLTLLPASRAKNITLLQHDANSGKGRAIRTGLDEVMWSHVIIQDADLEYDPADINKLWAVMQSGEADVVYGSRYLDKPELQKGRWLMQSGVRFLNLLVRLLYGVKLTDEACCYKMFCTADLRAMDLQCEKFEFCPEVTGKTALSGRVLREVPVAYHARSFDEGKKIQAWDALDGVWTLFAVRAEEGKRKSRSEGEPSSSVCEIPAVVTSLVLVTAAILKLESAQMTGRGSEFLHAFGELTLAGLLLSGFVPRMVALAAVFTFVLYAIYASFLVLTGTSECGCFGRLGVSPWISLSLNLFVLTFWVLMSGTTRGKPNVRLQGVWAAALCITIIGAAATGRSVAQATTAAITGRHYEVLQPQKWLGAQLPIMDAISIGDVLASGEWILVLHNSECASCREIHREFEDIDIPNSPDEGGPRLAFIEVGYKDTPLTNPIRAQRRNYEIGWLSPDVNWVAPVPTVISLADGVVTFVDEYASVGSSKRFSREAGR